MFMFLKRSETDDFLRVEVFLRFPYTCNMIQFWRYAVIFALKIRGLQLHILIVSYDVCLEKGCQHRDSVYSVTNSLFEPFRGTHCSC